MGSSKILAKSNPVPGAPKGTRSNVAVPLIIADAIDLPRDQTILLVQAAMFVAGVATIVQALGAGPIGGRVPIVMGTSFGFVPVILPIAMNYGLPAVFGAALIGVCVQLSGRDQLLVAGEHAGHVAFGRGFILRTMPE